MCHHVNLPLSVFALAYQQHQDPDPVNKDWEGNLKSNKDARWPQAPSSDAESDYLTPLCRLAPLSVLTVALQAVNDYCSLKCQSYGMMNAFLEFPTSKNRDREKLQQEGWRELTFLFLQPHCLLFSNCLTGFVFSSRFIISHAINNYHWMQEQDKLVAFHFYAWRETLAFYLYTITINFSFWDLIISNTLFTASSFFSFLDKIKLLSVTK